MFVRGGQGWSLFVAFSGKEVVDRVVFEFCERLV